MKTTLDLPDDLVREVKIHAVQKETQLCESNVWLALALSEHVHHTAARNWLGTVESTASVFFRRAPQQTLLRLLTARIASAMAADYLYLRDLVSSSLRSSGSSSHRDNG